MKLLIDDANVQKIKEISEFYPVDGVTTNPSILAKSGRPPFRFSPRSASSLATRSFTFRSSLPMQRE